ncbi:hypothetical protein A2U01_0108523, partial [Trifolium medium]|nr:hypothetical protein [Trifolium medium]
MMSPDEDLDVASARQLSPITGKLTN